MPDICGELVGNRPTVSPCSNWLVAFSRRSFNLQGAKEISGENGGKCGLQLSTFMGAFASKVFNTFPTESPILFKQRWAFRYSLIR